MFRRYLASTTVPVLLMAGGTQGCDPATTRAFVAGFIGGTAAGLRFNDDRTDDVQRIRIEFDDGVELANVFDDTES